MADDAPAFVDLHAAARAGDLEALGARVAAGDDVDGRDKHKRTALHMAAWAGQVRVKIRAPFFFSLRFASSSRDVRSSASRSRPDRLSRELSRALPKPLTHPTATRRTR
jgi:hypothetical protein